VKADAAGNTMYSGPGAGGAATASAVLADVVILAQQLTKTGGGRQSDLIDIPVLPISQTRCAYYLRIPARDEPGVFAQVANALSQHGISIEAAIQKEPQASQNHVAIVILTQVVQESQLTAAITEVQGLREVAAGVSCIRVEALD